MTHVWAQKQARFLCPQYIVKHKAPSVLSVRYWITTNKPMHVPIWKAKNKKIKWSPFRECNSSSKVVKWSFQSRYSCGEDEVLCRNPCLTWLLKVAVVGLPRLSYSKQILFHGLDVHGGAVALWKSGAALTPAVIVLADELSLGVAGDVTQSGLDKPLLKVVWKENL